MQIERAIKTWSHSSAETLLAALSEASSHEPNDDALASDLLEGAGSIAKFVFGDDRAKARRRIYHLSDPKRRDRLPVFRMGQIICGRKSTIRKWIATLETAEM